MTSGAPAAGSPGAGRGEARGLVAAMRAAYAGPRAAMARQLREGPGEPRALFYLMAACGLFFVASLPNAIRAARGIDAGDPVSAAIGAHLFGFLFLAPVLLYLAAGAVHLVARLCGGAGSAAASRVALFWSLLLAAPVAVLIALIGAAAEIVAGPAVLPWLGLLRYAGLAFWIWLFAACLAEAEGFQHGGRVAAALVAVFALVAWLLAALAGGGTV